MLQAPDRYSLFIDNKAAAGASGEMLEVIDPSSGHCFASIVRGQAADIDAAVRSARRAFDGDSGEPAGGVWGRTSALERGRLLMKLAAKVEAHREELGKLESRDTG
jgi:aldehyde dehydrogenase (NAD+)